MKYDRDEIMERICLGLSQGRSLLSMTKDAGMPHYGTVLRWLQEDEAQGGPLRDKYAHAREAQAEYYADQIIEIADDTSRDVDAAGSVNHEVVARSRLRIDARKWILARMLPKKYGDRLDVTSDGKELRPSTIHITREIIGNKQ